MTTEEKVASIISKVGLWWPLAEEDQLREAADAYDELATAVRAATVIASGGARRVTGGGNQGKAIASFATFWGDYDGDCSAGLPATSSAASTVAAALRQFADKVDEAKSKITDLAIEIGATIAVGAGLAVFTFGTSAGAAAARTAMLVARGAALATGLTGVAATIVTAMLAAGAFGAIDGFLAGIVAQVGKQALNDGPGIALNETMSWTATGAGGGVMFGGGGAALGLGVRALRPVAGAAANRLRAVNWADETGSIGPFGSPGEPIDVTEETIRKAMAGAPMQTIQDIVSLPKVKRYVSRLQKGSPAPPIAADGNVIIDGIHRYVAGRIVGKEPPVLNPAEMGHLEPLKPHETPIPWDRLRVETMDWSDG